MSSASTSRETRCFSTLKVGFALGFILVLQIKTRVFIVSSNYRTCFLYKAVRTPHRWKSRLHDLKQRFSSFFEWSHHRRKLRVVACGHNTFLTKFSLREHRTLDPGPLRPRRSSRRPRSSILKSLISDEHPRHFYMGVPPPLDTVVCLSPVLGWSKKYRQWVVSFWALLKGWVIVIWNNTGDESSYSQANL